jgi:hypothetical protein
MEIKLQKRNQFTSMKGISPTENPFIPDILFNVLTKYRVGFHLHHPLNKKAPQRSAVPFCQNWKADHITTGAAADP